MPEEGADPKLLGVGPELPNPDVVLVIAALPKPPERPEETVFEELPKAEAGAGVGVLLLPNIPKSPDADALPKPVDEGAFPNPIVPGALPKPLEGGALPKPLEGGALPKPLEGGALPKPFEGGALPKPPPALVLLVPNPGPDTLPGNWVGGATGAAPKAPVLVLPNPAAGGELPKPEANGIEELLVPKVVPVCAA